MKYDTQYSGAQIDVRYLLAYVLDRIIIVIAAMVAFAILFTVLGGMKTRNTAAVEPQEILDSYRSRLTDEEANAVEGLFIHYDMCMNYLYGYYGNMKCMKNAYRFETNKLYSDLLSEMLLISEENYDKISKIYGLEDRNIHKAYERIGLDIINDYEGNGSVATGITVFASVYGKDDAECKQVMEVIENALSAIEESLDPGEEISGPALIGSVITYGESSYMKESPDETVKGLVNIGNVLSGVTSASNWFSDDQKVYFNALRDNRKGRLGTQSETASGFSMKYPVLGAVLGFVASAGALVMIYLCNGKIKTSDELASRYGVEVAEPVSFDEGKKLFLRRWADKLRGATIDSTEINKADAIDSIVYSLKENSAKKAVLIYTDSPASIRMADRVIGDWKSDEAELVKAGDPSISREALKLIETADAAVAIVELDSTKQDTIDKWLSLCKRYKTSMEGIITVFSK